MLIVGVQQCNVELNRLKVTRVLYSTIATVSTTAQVCHCALLYHILLGSVAKLRCILEDMQAVYCEEEENVVQCGSPQQDSNVDLHR